jgi:hypothetical protein
MRYFLTCVFLVSGLAAPLSAERDNAEATQGQLDAIAGEFRARLGISQNIEMALVESNKYLVSVQRSSVSRNTFLIKFDRSFLSTLTEEELRAVIAHELGHIWVFTHHPFLQTEALANEKALQLVRHDSLSRVYEKVWRLEGQQGTLQDFLASVEPEPHQYAMPTSPSTPSDSMKPIP